MMVGFRRLHVPLLWLFLTMAPKAQTQTPARQPRFDDHQNMMDQLGIKALRPGPSGNESAPNHANYDEATANPHPNLPDVLTLKNGKKVTSKAMWWNQRRPEIVEEFEREVLGRVPKAAPKVNWEVTKTADATVGSHAVVGKQLLGHVDNSSYPDIKVDIQMTVVIPAHAKAPVPAMMMFGGRSIPEVAFPAPVFPGRGGPGAGAGRGPAAPPPNADPPAIEQLIADGWAVVTINPGSIQADNGAGLTNGSFPAKFDGLNWPNCNGPDKDGTPTAPSSKVSAHPEFFFSRDSMMFNGGDSIAVVSASKC